MHTDSLARNDLFAEIVKIPLIDPHSHIDPAPAHRQGPIPTICSAITITPELAHSAGMPKTPLAADVPPRERVTAILAHMDRFDNTAQYAWFLEIARTFLGYQGDRVSRRRRPCPVRRRRSTHFLRNPRGKTRCCTAPTLRRFFSPTTSTIR